MYPCLKKERSNPTMILIQINTVSLLDFLVCLYLLGDDWTNITWIDNVYTCSLIFFSRLYFTSLNKKQQPVRHKKTWAMTTFSWKQERWKPEFNSAARVHYITLTWRALTSSFKTLSSFSMHSAARVCFAWRVSQRKFTTANSFPELNRMPQLACTKFQFRIYFPLI